MDYKKKRYYRKKGSKNVKKRTDKNRCQFYGCNRILDSIPFKCKYCGRNFCVKHHLPESHDCKQFEEHQEKSRKKYRETVKDYIEDERIKRENKEKIKDEIYDDWQGIDLEKRPSDKIKITINSDLLTKFLLILIGLGLIIGLIFFVFFRNDVPIFQVFLNCTDGTNYGKCSNNKPLYCQEGKLINKSSLCGCPVDYKPEGEKCQKIKRCADGTIYDECSTEKPLYCSNGILWKKATLCGCPENEIPDGDLCVSKFETNPKNIDLEYTIRGNENNFEMTIYGGLNEYLSSLPRTYYCNPTCPTGKDLELFYIEEENQEKYLNELVDKIKSQTNNKDDQARISISLVQQIPYDWKGFETNNLNNRYPYEVLYDEKGVCGEKSRLLAFLLKKLGFGVALLNYEVESHMAVGIKCPNKYSYLESGYCFVEASTSSIVTDSKGDYVGVGSLLSSPEIIYLADGISFESVSEEYEDAREWNRLYDISESTGGFLESHEYLRWESLVEKYGIVISN
jgi:hypothetical protein